MTMATDIAQSEDAAGMMTPERIMQVGLGFWGSKVLLSAVGLGLFTVLARAPLDAEALRARLGLHPRGARDFFDALVALGFLEREEDGRYSNAADAELFLDREKPSYIGGMLEMADARLYPFWGSLTEGLRCGEPQNEAKVGDDWFNVLYSDAERLQQFMHAMTGLSMGASLAIAAKFPWERYQTFVDVGGAEGGLAVELARAHEHLTGTVFDLEPVEPLFRRYAGAQGVSDRLRFEAGDMLSDPFPAADVITMGHILHDWSLEQRRDLLRKAYAAVPDGGAVVVFDAVIDDERRQNAFGLLMSLNMLIETPAGSDYTGADCRGWMEEAGLRETYVEHLAGPDSMVVGLK
jgi:O-methyltransferase domain/Dimerisation domain